MKASVEFLLRHSAVCWIYVLACRYSIYVQLFRVFTEKNSVSSPLYVSQRMALTFDQYIGCPMAFHTYICIFICSVILLLSSLREGSASRLGNFVTASSARETRVRTMRGLR